MIDLNRSSIYAGEQQNLVLPLSAAQRGIWFAQQLNNEASAKVFKVIEYMDIDGHIDSDLLVRAIVQTHQETDAFQVNFEKGPQGEVCQVYAPRSCLVPKVDVSQAPDPIAAAREWIAQESARRFDPHFGPLCSFAVIQLSQQRYWYFSSAHHLVVDGFGARLFSTRVAQIYTALAQGEAIPPSEFTPLASVLELEQQYQQSQQYQKDQRYWVEQMEQRPAPLSLASRQAACVEIVRRQAYVPTATQHQLVELAHTLHTPLPQLLITLNALYLARMTGQQEVVLGCPMTGRRNKVARQCPSMMSNVLPLRLTLTPQSTLAQLVEQVKGKVMSTVRHQGYRGEALSAQLGLVNAEEALCLTHINILPFDYTMTFAGHSVKPHNLALGPIDDLAINICDRGAEQGLELCLDANRALYSDVELDAHFARLMNFYQQVVEQAHFLPVGQLPLLTAADEQHWVASNCTQADFGAFESVYTLFERQAALQPSAIAVSTMSDNVTYAQLNAQANQLAHYLRRLGVGAESKVAVCCDRSANWISALLAVFKAGGAYVPIDPAYPQERIEYMLQDSEPQVLLTDGVIDFAADCLADLDQAVQLVHLIEDAPLWKSESERNPDHQASGAQDLAYVIYTSGSTGKPKGVMVEHHTLTNLIHWHNHTFALNQSSVASSVAGMGFDAAVWEVWPPLAAGARLCLPDLAITRDPQSLLDWWQAQEVEVSFLPTPIAELAFAGQIAPKRLRYLLVGGDKLNRNVPENTHYTLVNNYGPTETTVVATSGAMNGAHTLHIGKPIANTQIYLLDEQRQRVPWGVTGEIYIGGAGVARGYLNLPEQTAERFVVDPFLALPNSRMYRTGDLATLAHDGTLIYQGRNDNQVKIRGYRIELGEIAHALQQCAGVEMAAVQVLKEQNDQRIVAYYTQAKLNAQSELNPSVRIEELHEQLAATLPIYMVPSAFVCLEQLPLTANGKVDYRALPHPSEDAYIHRAYEAPQNEQEQLLADIWQQLLGVEQVGRQDNFFELGGHSLLAVQLIEQLRQRSIELTIKTLFAHPTLAELSSALGAASTKAPARTPVPHNRITLGQTQLTPQDLSLIELEQAHIDAIVEQIPGKVSNIQEIYPLAPLQEGILFHHMLAQEGDPYITRAIKAFTTEQEMQRFVAALQAVVNRHDILRTSVLWQGLPEPVQVVWREAPLQVQQLELTEEDKVEALKAHFAPEITRINVHRAPMMALAATEDAAHERWLLCLMMHHLCFDHTTLELMMEEVQAHLLGKEDLLPAPLPFRDFVYESRQQVDLEAQRAYFTRRLADIDEPCAPFQLLDIQGDGSDTTEYHLPLEDALAEQIRAVAKQHGVSAATLFHLAWALVIRAATGRDDVVFGTVLFGRMAAGDGANRVLGMFLNTLPLRLSLSTQLVAQAIQETQQHLAEMLDYEHASLALAQQCSSVAPQSPLFTALINYRYDGGSRQTEIQAQSLDLLYAEERTNYPMVLSINDHGLRGFSLDVQVARSVGSERVAAMMVTVLSNLVATQAVSKPIHQIGVVPDSELQYLQRLAQGNPHPKVHEIAHENVVNLFARHAKKYPADVALRDVSGEMSYGELDKASNQLAHQLIHAGVGAEQRVALCFDRTRYSIIAMLAVLKAGGAYVPMDPHYPLDRLAYMVENSEPTLILTDGIVDFVPVLAAMSPDSCLHAQANRVWNLMQETDWRLANSEPVVNTIKGNQLAYMIYTSGSTGKPKGVMVEHSQLLHLVAWHNPTFAITRQTPVSAVAGVGFDASVWEIWPPLCAGARLHLPTLAVSKDPEQLLHWWQYTPIEVGFLSTPIAELAMQRKLTHPTLRYLLVGGDRLNRLPAADATYQLVNNYGPTETTVVATSGVIASDATVIDIGQPISGTQIHLLDSYGQRVPYGVIGELYIGGTGVARGYFKLAEMTEQRFIADPFTKKAMSELQGIVIPRLYRSGDLGRWREDGTLEYLGRNDSQVKIRGFRIELGEISACLNTHSGVSEATVTVNREQNTTLVAYYVGQAQPQALKVYLAARLPEYMVPVAYVKLDALPLTANGKVDYRALPAPQPEDLAQQAYLPPEGEIEQTIAGIWQRLLGVKQIGRQDSFFELGGHSMLAVQFLNEARQHGYELSLAALFTSSRLADIADVIARHGEQADMAVALRAAKAGERPLFIVPEASGEMMYAPLLASYIDPTIPVYGLSAPDRNDVPFKTVEAAAARFARLMRDVQPQGPYRLTGISLGGTLAWEISQQLLGQDQQVEYVGIVDTSAVKPQVERHQLRAQMSDEQQLTAMSKEVFDGLAADILSLNQEVTAEDPNLNWYDYYLEASAMGMLPSGWSEHYYRQWLLHREGILAADYHYQALPMAMDLLIAEERPVGESVEMAAYLGWDRFMAPQEIKIAMIKETNHYHVFVEPYIGYMAEAMSQGILARQAQYEQGARFTHDYPEQRVEILHQGDNVTNVVIYLLDTTDLLLNRRPHLSNWGHDCLVLALRPRGLNGLNVPHSAAEAAAEYYWQSIQSYLQADATVHVMGAGSQAWVAIHLGALVAQYVDSEPQVYLDRVEALYLEHGTPDVTMVEVILNWCNRLAKLGWLLGITEQDIAQLDHPQRIALLDAALIAAKPRKGCQIKVWPTAQEIGSLMRIEAAQQRMACGPSVQGSGCQHWLLDAVSDDAYSWWQQKLGKVVPFTKSRSSRRFNESIMGLIKGNF